MTNRRKPVNKWVTNDPEVFYMGSEYNHDFHFFSSSFEYYRVGTNLVEMLDFFHKKQAPFRVWYVPQDPDIDYKIINFAPQVEGAQLLAGYSLPQ